MLKRQPISVSLLCLLLGALVTGCGRQTLPTSPRTGLSGSELRFIQLPGPEGGDVLLGGQTYVEGELTVQHGGRLKLKYASQGVKINIKLRVRRHSVPKDVIASLSLEPDLLITEIDLVLGPSGLEFLRPAILKIKAKGLDLSGVDRETFGLYYYDEESGLWEVVEPVRLTVNFEEGKIKGHWLVEHFSRYALASR